MNTARGMDTRIRKNPFVRLLFDLAVRLSDKVTVVSEAMREIPGLESAEVITSGVDPVFFGVTPDTASKTVLYTRSLEPVYDAETLVKSVPLVLERCPGRFVLAGSGSREPQLKALADKLGVAGRINFLGHVPHEMIPGLAAGSRVFVSTAKADGTSVALLEAMAAGLVPVASDIGANRALLTHGTDGFLFRPGDEHDLAAMLARALSENIPTGVLLWKKASLKENLPWSIIADRYVHSYNRFIARHFGQAR
jgi:glycosyltransferase involved in cell wall biosynthesis